MNKTLLVGVLVSLIAAACATTPGPGASPATTAVSDFAEPSPVLALPQDDDGEVEMPDAAVDVASESPPTMVRDNTDDTQEADVDGQDPPSEPDGEGSRLTEEVPSPGSSPPPSDDTDSVVSTRDLPLTVQLAIDHLAHLVGLSPEAVHQVSHQNVTWPDSSLGCPRKSRYYTQVLTSGTLTVLEAGGVEYAYHAGPSGEPFLCVAPTDPVPPGVGSDL